MMTARLGDGLQNHTGRFDSGSSLQKTFPYYPTDREWRKEKFDSYIRYQGYLWDGKDIKQTMHGLALSWSYMPHAYAVQCKNLRSPLQTFQEEKYEVLKKKIDQLNLGETPDGLRRVCKIITGSQGVSNFRPTAAHAIYRKYLPDGGLAWDMSGGYGGRLLGAIKANIDYITTEPSKKTVNGLREIIQDWGYTPNVFGTKSYLEVVQSGSEEFVPDIESLDFCFTSPPYFDTEKYSDEESQSYIKFPTKSEWVDGFLRRTIQNCRYGLKQNRYMLINIANVDSFSNLEEECKRVAIEEGFIHEDTFRLALSKLNAGGFKYEPILIFKKWR